MILMISLLTACVAEPNPHQHLNLTWSIINMATGKFLNSTSWVTSLGTWFPDFHIDLCDLMCKKIGPSLSRATSQYPAAYGYNTWYVGKLNTKLFTFPQDIPRAITNTTNVEALRSSSVESGDMNLLDGYTRRTLIRTSSPWLGSIPTTVRRNTTLLLLDSQMMARRVNGLPVRLGAWDLTSLVTILESCLLFKFMFRHPQFL